MFTARAASKRKWEFEFRREHVGLHPVLVWKPCRQSPSPFLPFYQFSVGGSFEYLRVDGEAVQRVENRTSLIARRAQAREQLLKVLRRIGFDR